MTLRGAGRVPIQLLAFVLILISIFSITVLGLPYNHLFVFSLAVFVFFIAFLNTDIALVIIILSMLLSPELRTGAVSTREVYIRLEDLFVFVVFLGWMAKMAVRKELGLFRKNALNLPIFLYMVACVVSSLLAVMAQRLTFHESSLYLLKYFEYYLLFFLVCNNLQSLDQAKRYLNFLLITCAIVSVVAWVQLPSGQRISAPFEGGRVSGGEPNTLAGYFILMMSLILSFLLYARTLRMRLFWGAFFALAFVPFVYTLSREGWFSFIPVLLMLIVLHRRSRLLIVFGLIVLALCAPFIVPESVKNRFADTFSREKTYQVLGRQVHMSESAGARVDTWKTGFEKLAQKPVLGFGVPGAKTVDNQYSRVLIETGIVGFIFFGWILALLFQAGLRVFRHEDNEYAKALSLGFIAALTGLLFQSFGAAVFILIRIMEPFWFVAALVVTMPELLAENPSVPSDGT